MVTAALLLFSYGLLLGEKKWWRMAIIAVALGIVLHIIFSGIKTGTDRDIIRERLREIYG